MIEFRSLCKKFGTQEVLNDVTLKIENKQVQFIIGMSGAGKSVLVKHVVGLLRADSGEIYLDGEEISRLRERDFFRIREKCGMVFQNPTLFDGLSIRENIAMPLRKRWRGNKKAANDLADEALDLVHMSAYGDTMPFVLGAGLKKRAAIARALALKPQYLIYDEPTTGLDPLNARRTDALIKEMAQTTGITSIVVSHDLRSITDVATQVALLHERKLRFVGTPQMLKASADPVVQQFISGSAMGPIHE